MALELEPGNLKALWRRASIRKELGSLNLSYLDYQSALVLEPTNKTLIDEANKVKDLMNKKVFLAPPPPPKKSQSDYHHKHLCVESGGRWPGIQSLRCQGRSPAQEGDCEGTHQGQDCGEQSSSSLYDDENY